MLLFFPLNKSQYRPVKLITGGFVDHGSFINAIHSSKAYTDCLRNKNFAPLVNEGVASLKIAGEEGGTGRNGPHRYPRGFR